MDTFFINLALSALYHIPCHWYNIFAVHPRPIRKDLHTERGPEKRGEYCNQSRYLNPCQRNRLLPVQVAGQAPLSTAR